jgi:hypothetical protein
MEGMVMAYVRYYPSISNLLKISMDNDDGNLYLGYQIKKK